jgi:hypothetical protein
LGGAGSGFGTSALRLANKALRDGFAAARFVAAANLGAGLVREGFFAAISFRFLAEETVTTFFFGTAFFTGRFTCFFAAVACFRFLIGGAFLLAAFLADFGAAVIRPGRFGFRVGAFFPFVARIF